MKTAIIPNLTKKDSFAVSSDICAQLAAFGVECLLAAEHREIFSACAGAVFLREDELYDSCDLVIAVGGDGSVLHAAKKAAPRGKAVLGVNTGCLAFMAGLERHELRLLNQLAAGEYTVERCLALKTELYDGPDLVSADFCVNDAVFARGGEIRPVDLVLECDGGRVGRYRADGVIIATPTGSTAYSLSAGGAVADPSAQCVLATPISGHSLTARPMIFRADSELRVRPAEAGAQSVYMSCDGEKAVRLTRSMYAVITKADFSVDFVRLKQNAFWDTLYTKLFQN